ncbi:MAG: cobaltochelatase subunit CobN [Euryarchaeota archaeon]|nr:cobaltochelatase subunit CobN [Euryarchaeota archaeon]
MLPNDESFEIIKDIATDAKVPVFSTGSEMQLANVPPDVLARAQQYRMCSGVENIKNLILFMAQHCKKSTIEPAPPEDMPWDGIYHPDAGQTFESPDDYNKWYQKKGDHTAGILFHRTGWLEGDTLVCDALVREFEANGINVLPVFSHGFENTDLGIDGNDIILNKYFMKDGVSVIDILINLEMFFLLPRREGEDHPTGDVDILKRLNVPVIQGVISYHRTETDWRERAEMGLIRPGS